MTHFNQNPSARGCQGKVIVPRKVIVRAYRNQLQASRSIHLWRWLVWLLTLMAVHVCRLQPCLNILKLAAYDLEIATSCRSLAVNSCIWRGSGHEELVPDC